MKEHLGFVSRHGAGYKLVGVESSYYADLNPDGKGYPKSSNKVLRCHAKSARLFPMSEFSTCSLSRWCVLVKAWKQKRRSGRLTDVGAPENRMKF
jgi:hypothetical protein